VTRKWFYVGEKVTVAGVVSLESAAEGVELQRKKRDWVDVCKVEKEKRKSLGIDEEKGKTWREFCLPSPIASLRTSVRQTALSVVS